MSLQPTALPAAISMPFMEEFRSNYDRLWQSMNYSPVGSTIAPCFHYLAATEKAGHKKFVARLPPESKTLRQALKKLFKQALNQFPWISLLPADFSNRYHPQRDHASIRFQVKNGHDYDLYELINTIPLHDRMNGPMLLSRKVLIKNNSLIYCLAEGEENLVSLRVLSSLFNGNRLEIVNLEPTYPEPNEFWDEWMEDYPIGEDYEKIWHPAMAKACLHVLQHIPAAKPQILEICGGYGLLADKILHTSPIPLDYILLELNEIALSKAQDNLGNRANLVRIDVVDNPFPAEDDSIDLVIGCGALTTSVLADKNEATEVLKKIECCLKPGGYLILAGHGDSLLHREDFTHFTILNTSLPGYRKEFYLLQKTLNQSH